MPRILSDYDFQLPPSLVAQYPLQKRDGGRLLVVGENGAGRVCNIPALLSAGDVLVVNNSRVFPARVFGGKESGGRVEILAERFLQNGTVVAQVRGKNLKTKDAINVGDGKLIINGREKEMTILAAVDARGQPVAAKKVFIRHGQTPLPPYIKRAADENDKSRYQTVYARPTGSVAAPTAGLHFTKQLLDKIKNRGVKIVNITLHIGAGTFSPIRGSIASHKLHSEFYRVTKTAAADINRAKKGGKKIIAVGTSVLRTLETVVDKNGTVIPGEGQTDLFIRDEFCFRVADCLLTNFHLPKSGLLILTCAFGGYEKIMRAYQFAVDKKFRFYSYGDAMFVRRDRI